MKKIFLSITFLLFIVSAFGQVMKPVKIDSLVTVSLPPGYQKKDTLGQQIFTVNGLFGYMVIIREANAKGNTPLKKEKDLNKVLKDYIKGIQKQVSDGTTQNVRDTTIGTLKAKIFTLQSDEGGDDIQLRNFILIYTQEVTYTFEYVYPDNRKDLIKDEYKAFVNSIKFSADLQRNDQYLSNANGLSLIVKIAIGAGVLLIIIVIIVVVRRKRSEA